MIQPDTIVILVIVLAIAVALLIILKPETTANRGGKILAFLSLFIFPILAGLLGASSHIEHSKTTQFCLSCHEMKPFGKSLHIDDSEYVPAAHYQNIRVPRETTCYTCHTNYTLYGDVAAKLRGLRHVYVHYLGTIPQPKDIRLYTPYSNRECLHCHLGARTFEDGATHNEESNRLALIKSNKLSCVSSGCHELTHSVAKLDELKFWEETRK
jgi:cytochrome c-type protein NapC